MLDREVELSLYRYNLAVETLDASKLCLENKLYRTSINRSYYAVFYALKAVLVLEGTDFKRHKDVIAYFNKEYVAGEVFPRDVGKRIGRLQTIREASDYDDFYVASLEDTKSQIETAEFILPLIKAYLSEKGIFKL